MLGLLGGRRQTADTADDTPQPPPSLPDLAQQVKACLEQVRATESPTAPPASTSTQTLTSAVSDEPVASGATTADVASSRSVGVLESMARAAASAWSRQRGTGGSDSAERARRELAQRLVALKQYLYDDVERPTDAELSRMNSGSSAGTAVTADTSPPNVSPAGSCRGSLDDARAAAAAATAGASPHPAELAEQRMQLQALVYDHELLLLLASSLPYMQFESRKDAAAIFNNLLRRQASERNLQVDLPILEALMQDYGRASVALTCGAMLREAFRHDSCVRAFLFQSERFWLLFHLVQLNNFDVASDAFTTLRAVLTKHKKVAADFLLQHFDRFFLEEYAALLRSPNYVTKRQGLKLLGEILLDRSNFYAMTRYISLVENLKLIMVLMLDPGRSIQYEAFHIFKLIVANPKKPAAVKKILARNKDKLLRYLAAFGSESRVGSALGDDAFREDLRLVVSEVENLPPPNEIAVEEEGEEENNQHGEGPASARERVE